MKTTNNVQKAITKSMAVIISLVLISITVNAQDFWRTVLENNSFSQIAIAMVDNTEVSTAPADAYSTTDMDAYSEYTIVETEEALEVENWMVNENNFFTTINVETEVEEALEIEKWMTNESLFNGTAGYFEVETEEALEIENWMVNENNFFTSISIETEVEEALEVEEWMTNPEYFNVQTLYVEVESEEALELEEWMTNNKVWEM